MKKLLLFLLPLAMVVSCSKDEEPQYGQYEIINRTSYTDDYEIPGLNSTMYDVIVLETSENDEVLKQAFLGDIAPEGGSSGIQIAADECTSIIITFFFLPKDEYPQSFNTRQVIGHRYSITKGYTTTVTVTEKTGIVELPESYSLKSSANNNSRSFENAIKGL